MATSTSAASARVRDTFSQLPDAVHDLGRRFEAAGFELALVGGPVRDALLGRDCADLDFTTSARPDDTEAILRAWGSSIWEMGRDFGTIGGQRGDLKVEITTYRTETYDADSRKPQQVDFGDTLEGDLSRRDFTVNSMAVRLPSLELVDPFDGVSALELGELDTPVTPEQSFDDDPLRMLRGARFAAQLGFSLSQRVCEAMTALAPRIAIVSAERVRDELCKTILAESPRRGFEALVEFGLADHVLPELPALTLEMDEHHRHKDVYEHSLTVLDQAIALETGPDGAVPAPDLVLRWAALLHDIGKPPTRRFEPGGGVSFHHHEIVGAKMARRRMRALKFDNDTIKAVSRLIELHLRFHGYGDQSWTDAAVRRYVTDAGDVLHRLHRLTRSDCTTRNRARARKLATDYDDLEHRIEELSEKEELAAVRPSLNGEQIMEILGIKPGREVGAAYKHLLEVRFERGPLDFDEARAELLAWWESREA
ncbi:CCA tRNA nucleotidyltransferase [Micrococcales bacterium 31B]|nr:CCA tRNA nucleotidyltransferase [Micrococcales bacterium 31B]